MADVIGVDLQNPRMNSLGGNAFNNIIYLSTGDEDLQVLEFIKDVDGKFYARAHIPADYGTVTTAKIIFDIIANATTGVTRMQISTAPIADDETVDVAKTGITAEDVTVAATAYKTKKVTATIASAPVADDLILIEIYHVGTHANDTLAVNTQIVNMYMELT